MSKRKIKIELVAAQAPLAALVKRGKVVLMSPEGEFKTIYRGRGMRRRCRKVRALVYQGWSDQVIQPAAD